VRWLEPPRTRPDAAEVAASLRSPDEFFAYASALGARSLTVIDRYDLRLGVDLALDDVAEAFARFCDGAAEYGLLAHLEFYPWSGIRDLGTTYEIVRRAGRPNGGILFDTWHHLRGPDRGDPKLDVPGERIFAVQVNDVRAQPW